MKITLNDPLRTYKTEGMDRTADAFGQGERVLLKDVVMFSLLFGILTLTGFSQDNTAFAGFEEQRLEQLELKIQELEKRLNDALSGPDAFPVFANPLTAARSAKAWGLGLNWYINRNLKFSTDFERTRFVGGASDGNRETEYALFSRVQVAY